MKFFKIASLIFFAFSSLAASAESLLGYLTDGAGKYIGPSVEDNIAIMDTDKNGFADVTEVRAFLAQKHGKDYQKAVLDRWEVQSLGGGCPIPFAKEFYSESSK
jgi:hypothetical protein